jgi:hypothetical protein
LLLMPAGGFIGRMYWIGIPVLVAVSSTTKVPEI